MIKAKLNNPDRLNYFIVISSLFVANPFFSSITNLYLLLLLLFLLIISVKRKIKLTEMKVLLVLAGMYLLIGIQIFIFKGYSVAALYVPLITFYIPYLLYKILGVSFFNYFLKILVIIAVFTFPLWLLQSLFSPFDNLMHSAIQWVYPFAWEPSPRSLLFFTPAWDNFLFNSSLGLYRNSGLFHEPGAYSVFLNLGIVLNTLINGKLFDRKNQIFIVCLLSTFSTAGYISLFLILSYFLGKSKIILPIKALAIGVFILISIMAFENGDFLKSKIEMQYEAQTYAAGANLGRFSNQSGRFFAFFTSLDYFLENPVFGQGIIYATSIKATGEMETESSYSYGFMGILATYGFFFGSFYLIFLFRGFQAIGKLSGQKTSMVTVLFIAMMLVLSTQIFITTVIVALIFIIGLYSQDNKQTKNFNLNEFSTI